jgi:adenosine deaminase
MQDFGYFFLDQEKDMIVSLQMAEDGRLYYELSTPNHHTGNLIRNFAHLCNVSLTENSIGLQVMRGEVPCYVDGNNQLVYVLRLANTKIANIYPDGRIERKATVPAIAKTLMSQTKQYKYGAYETIFKTYVFADCKFHSDLHTHMNANLSPDTLIALGIVSQIRYPLYLIRKLNLEVNDRQMQYLLDTYQKNKQGRTARQAEDMTYLNFADLILNNLDHAEANIVKIRISLSILKDGQAVFTNLEKVYQYRYVFTKGVASDQLIVLHDLDRIPDKDVARCAIQMMKDKQDPRYAHFSLFQNKLLWIARTYQKQGVAYTEISDTTLVKNPGAFDMLAEVHDAMPAITQETGVTIRFLAAMRRIPLQGIEQMPQNYLVQNLSVLSAVAADPYVAGCDFVGEEINDILTLKPLFKVIDQIAAREDGFVIRIHAGENDSLKVNMSHAIACVKDCLAPGQKMPEMRLGHGLYTVALNSAKGKKLLKELADNHIVLEFQITSNVRLNNLTTISRHPLRTYLASGIPCVQGTDGAAIYGTNSMDEQLALARLLHLSHDEMRQMRRAEEEAMAKQLACFARKMDAQKKLLQSMSLQAYFANRLSQQIAEVHLPQDGLLDSSLMLKGQIQPLPADRIPVIIAGGSFNTEERKTRMQPEAVQLLQNVLDQLDPDQYFLVVGHTMSAYEKYAVEHAHGCQVYAFVPSRMKETEIRHLKQHHVYIRISPETIGAALYKSFNYEIFERRPSVVIAFDGNSAGENLIQEARNGKGRASIYVYANARNLKKKAESLQGYVTFFSKEHCIVLPQGALQFTA